jgi:hypothetical protein
VKNLELQKGELGYNLEAIGTELAKKRYTATQFSPETGKIDAEKK